MPLILTKKGKELLESLVRDIYAGMLLLQLVQLEQATVQIGYPAEKLLQLWRTLRRLERKPFMKKPQEEVAIEAEEFPFSFPLLDCSQPVPQVIRVTVEKSLALDEIDEHQAVEHERGIPFFVSLLGDALDEFEKCRVLLLEVVVELLCDLVAVEGVSQAEYDTGKGKPFFFAQGKGDGFQLLDE